MKPRSATRVLLIDDDEDDRLLTRDLLRGVTGRSYEVSEADNAAAGLDALLSGQFDVCMLDFWLGSEDGVSVLRRARSLGARVPVILLTGMEDAAVDAAAMAAGASDFLPKADLSRSTLDRAIRYAIQHAAAVNELRRSNLELEHFARIVSHDLRAPMQPIVACAELLSMRAPPGDEASAALTVQLLTAVHRLDQMLTDMLEFALVDVPSGTELRASASSCLAAALTDLSSQISSSGARVHSAPIPDVRCPDTMLTRIFLNLIGNALKFRSAAPLEVGVTAETIPGSVLVHVADNGMGIPQNETERIFDLFGRGSRTRDMPGTGVGLAVCRKIAERYGGSLVASSSPGGGSCFTLRLPAA